MFPSNEYIAGLFDGEGSLSFATGKRIDGRNTHSAVIRLANSNRLVLELVKKRFGGTLHTYKPNYPGARLNHVLHVHHNQAKPFLEAIVPHLIVKRNLAWIVLCFLNRGVKPRGNSLKGYRGWQRLSADDLALRSALRELAMKINSRKGKTSLLRLDPEIKPHNHRC